MEPGDISAQRNSRWGLSSPGEIYLSSKKSRNSKPVRFLNRPFQKERRREHFFFLFIGREKKNWFYLTSYPDSMFLEFWDDVYEGRDPMTVAAGKRPKVRLKISLLLKSSGYLSNWNFAWSTAVSADSGLLPCFLIPFPAPHCLLLPLGHLPPLDFPKKLNFPYIIMQSNCFFHSLLGSGEIKTFSHLGCSYAAPK